MRHYKTELLFAPEDEPLRYLPEGPLVCGPGLFSWVAIQHGSESLEGSLNIFDVERGTNRNYPLPGRPGFAFPTTQAECFLIGIERQLQMFDCRTGRLRPLSEPVDADVEGTIINDAAPFRDGIVFGTKDLQFRQRKAGLYLWRLRDRRLTRLRDDQICSNGKVVLPRDNGWLLWDIDSPSQTIVRYDLDVDGASLSEPAISVDLRGEKVFPDGMVLTPDEQSAIVAIYNPQDAQYGEVRQYGLDQGDLQAIWKVPGSPQVTCPLLMPMDGQLKLVVATAAENMPPEKRRRYPHAGSFFIGDTPFEQVEEPVRLDVERGMAVGG